jgi:hypothetical protein
VVSRRCLIGETQRRPEGFEFVERHFAREAGRIFLRQTVVAGKRLALRRQIECPLALGIVPYPAANIYCRVGRRVGFERGMASVGLGSRKLSQQQIRFRDIAEQLASGRHLFALGALV